MSFESYAALQLEIADYLARSDLNAKIPSFITLAEAKFNRSLFVRQMEQRATALVLPDSAEPEYISLPLDFQSMRRVRLSSATGKPRLDFLSGVQADEYRHTSGDAAGQPQFFTIFGDEIELIRTPDADYTIEMIYRKNIPALSALNTSNWLLALAPDAYLYGALLESAPYIKDDDRIQVWAAGLSSVIEGLNNLGTTSTFNSGPLEMRTSGVTP
jgi:hypothetical protein